MFYIQQNEKIVLFDEDKQRLQNTIAFMPQYEGLEIKEVQEGYVIYDFELMTVEEMEAKQAQQERERLNLLSMTKREMFLGLYQAKGITPDMLKAQITDPQALIEFEYANDYYRGNPLIDVIGTQLGFTTEQLDRFFMNKDYHELLEILAEEQASDAVDTPVDTTRDDIKESEETVVNSTDTNMYSFDDI